MLSSIHVNTPYSIFSYGMNLAGQNYLAWKYSAEKYLKLSKI